MPQIHGSWVCVSGRFGEVPPGDRGSPEQRTADGSLPPAGQLHSCAAAQPEAQSELRGRFDALVYFTRVIIPALT